MAMANDNSLNSPSVPFKPSPEQLESMPRFARSGVPTYLFRVYTENSTSSTTTSHVHPPLQAYCHLTSRHDIFSLDARRAAALVNSHFRNHPSPGLEEVCNLTSWTSSLLCALQYALYRWHRHDHTRGPDGKAGTTRKKMTAAARQAAREAFALGNVKILAISTLTFPPGTFVKDIELLAAFAQHDDDLQELLRARRSPVAPNPFAQGEYLSQGPLCIPPSSPAHRVCALADLGTLVAADVFALLPPPPPTPTPTPTPTHPASALAAPLSAGAGAVPAWEWAAAAAALGLVAEARARFPPAEAITHGMGVPNGAVVTTRDILAAQRVADQGFAMTGGGNDWRVPMAAMALAMVPRRRRDPAILRAFGANLQLVSWRVLANIKVDSKKMAELAQFKVLIAEIYNLGFRTNILGWLEPHSDFP